MKHPFFSVIFGAGLVVLFCPHANALTASEQADAFHVRGVAAEKRGDLIAAENCYTLALRVNANHTAAQAALVDLENRMPVKLKPSASHTFQNDRVDALNDGKEPSSSGDSSIPRFTWYPHQGTFEWVQYDFAKPQVIEGCSVYWFQDNGGVKLPEFWKVLFLDDTGVWMPVDIQPPPPTLNAWNTSRFKPVRTKGLRLAAQLGSSSAGILEWKIIPSSVKVPPPLPQPQELRLDDLVPLTAKVGWGTYAMNRYTEARDAKLLLDAKPCDHFLYAHASSSISFEVPARYLHFSAIGIGPTIVKRKEYSWTYQVLADGKSVYQSKRLDTYPEKNVAIEVDLPPGTRTIALITDSCGSNFADHSVWAHPKLSRDASTTSANPKLLPPPLSAETQAKLTQLETQFKSACATKVEPAYTQAMQALAAKYLVSLQRGVEIAQRSGDQGGFAALQEEVRRVKAKEPIPDTDVQGTQKAMIPLRAAYRTSAKAAAGARAAQIKALYDQYDSLLASLATSLATKPAEAAAVNAVRSRAAASFPTTPMTGAKGPSAVLPPAR